jgi:hypothetical protein
VTDIPREKEEFFHRVYGMKDCKILAFYEIENTDIFFYERNNCPFCYSFDRNNNYPNGAPIPIKFTNFMEEFGNLQKENERLKEKIKTLNNKLIKINFKLRTKTT